MPQSAVKHFLLYLLFFILLLPAAIFCFKKPYYNWDMLGYMGIVLKMESSDIKVIHDQTYSLAKANLPAHEYSVLVSPESPYRKTMAESPEAFYNQLPFYIIKPLYIGFVYAFNAAGYNLPISTVLPSILAYMIIGLLLFHWFKQYLSPGIAFLAGLLNMYSTYMISGARSSTPDLLSAMFLFIAMYFIIERPSVRYMFLFLLLSIFTRVDNIIAAIFILSLLAFSGKWIKQISWRQYSVMAGIFIGSYFAITQATTIFGWSVLFYPTFARTLDLSYGNFHAGFPVKEYLALMYSKAITAVVFAHLTTFLFLLMLALLPWKRDIRKLTFDQAFCLLLVLIIVVRFVLFPDLSDRFYISFFLIILVLLVKRFTEAIGVLK